MDGGSASLKDDELSSKLASLEQTTNGLSESSKSSINANRQIKKCSPQIQVSA